MTVIKKEMMWGNRRLVLETGRIALQADGAVLASYGETTVLCTVVGSKKVDPTLNFFPLSVHYLEKSFAAGRIPGGFFKREGKPSEKEVLTSRLIDRPLRPLFPEGFFNEVQVLCTVMSHDMESDSEILAMIGASAALSISGIPFMGPIAGARVTFKDGAYVINPSSKEMGDLDLVVAGTHEGVLMVESEANELSEEIMLGAVQAGFKAFQPVIQLINELKAEAGKEPWVVDLHQDPDFVTMVEDVCTERLVKAYEEKTKKARYAAIDAVKAIAVKDFESHPSYHALFGSTFEAIKARILRNKILKESNRVDGRGLANIRPITTEVGVLPRVHGSALFTRGETQALVVSTLGTSADEQLIDAIEGEYRERFLLHYNFPPYSVGETGRVGAPGRREVGHGKLAWRAIHPVLPSKEECPYTLRTVSEITACNGSSSMATVCGASLSLMDAGVPLKRPVAGIAMGLIKEDKNFAILSDILGDEDALGDMDFKVAGTEQGITALQMDIKITSITPEIMEKALEQARVGRLHILNEMSHTITKGRDEVSAHAPRMISLMIAKDKIRELIGPGGKVIREICETTGVKVEVDDSGKVTIAGPSQDSLDKAIHMVKNIACEPEVGDIYQAKVVKVMEYGVFVSFMGGREALVHVSEMSKERIENVADMINVGDSVTVKVVGTDDRGRIRLTMKGVNG